MQVEIVVAWGDMDAYGHVNNAVFLRWFETARIKWFEQVEFPDVAHKIGPVLKTASVVYEKQVQYPGSVLVKVAPTRIGNSSVTLAYEVSKVDSTGQAVSVASGETVVVLVDFEDGKPRAIDPEARARINANISQR